jgi:rare lipoprotein A
LIDLSYAAALKLGVTDNGTARVEVRALSPVMKRGQTDQVSLASESNRFFVQLGAFAQRDNAVQLASSLPAELVVPVRISTTTGSSGELYRVRVGPFDQRNRVETAADSLRSQGFADLQIVVESCGTSC